MNIQVNRHQLERVIIKWLDKHFGNLTQKRRNGYVNSVYYVNLNDEVMMEYNKGTERVYINYGQIWSRIESLFHLNSSDVQSIIKVWLEEDYKLEGVTPRTGKLLAIDQLEED